MLQCLLSFCQRHDLKEAGARMVGLGLGRCGFVAKTNGVCLMKKMHLCLHIIILLCAFHIHNNMYVQCFIMMFMILVYCDDDSMLLAGE
jgi:hypothetical protein